MVTVKAGGGLNIVIHRDRYISEPLSAFVDLLHATYSVWCGIEPAIRWPAGAP